MQMDELWTGGPKFYRSPDVLPLGTDAVLLSHFAAMGGAAKTVCDLGCGSGVIALLLALKDPARTCTGIEIQEPAVLLARKNMELNGLSHRVTIFQGDLREYRRFSSLAGTFDLTVSNPPYFPVKSGSSSENSHISIAREELLLNLSDVCRAASYLTRWGGRFSLVHRPERLSEVCCRLSENGLEPKRLRFVHSKKDALPSLVLMESRRGGKPGLRMEPPLILSDNDGSDTEEIKSIYHRF